MESEKPLILHFIPSPGTLGGIWNYTGLIANSDLQERYVFDRYSLKKATKGVEPRLILELTKLFKQKRPDILHMHGLHTTVFHAAAAAKLARLPRKLLAIHVFIEDSHFQRPWKKALTRELLEPYTLRTADFAYNVSAFGAAKPAMTHYARNNRGVIDTAVEFIPRLVPDPALRASFGFSQDDVIALCVSRAEMEKGWHLLAEAMEQLDREGRSQPKLLLVGDGDHRQMIYDRLKPLVSKGLVATPGRRDDVNELHAISDFFVMPTSRDYQPVVFLDAMLQHKPVLTTRIGGNPEIVVDGSTGILIPPNDVRSLIAEMKRLTDEPALRTRLGDAGRIQVESKFDLHRMNAQIGAIYDEMMDKLPG